MSEGDRIDESALVGYAGERAPAADVRLGPGARLRSGTVIYRGVTAGRRLETGHGVVIREECVIGDDVCIWSNSVLDYGSRVGDRVKIHSNVYVAQFTVIEDDAFVAPGVTIANDLHPGCPRSRECMKGPVIRRGARIGAGSVILPRVEIGAGALVGAGAVVTRDVEPGYLVVGSPARHVKRIEEIECRTGLVDRPYGGERR